MDTWTCPACDTEQTRAVCPACGASLRDAYHAERARSAARAQLVRTLEAQIAAAAPPPDEAMAVASRAVRRALDEAGAPRDTPHMGDGWWDGAARRIAGLAHKRDLAEAAADRMRAQVAELIAKLDALG